MSPGPTARPRRRSHLLEGTVRHRRSRPSVYALEHGVWYLALDLDELTEVDRRLRLLTRNRPGVTEFRDRDHLVAPGDDVRAGIIDHLRAAGEDPTGWRITLVTSPRVLGYVFNPASFFLCRDALGVLRVVVVEVHNTHHERHLYTLRSERGAVSGDGTTGAAHGDAATGAFSASMAKAFYVSPFIDLAGRYSVGVTETADALRIGITHRQDGAPVLGTSLVLRRRPLTDRTLLRLLLRHPLVTHKTTLAIHWHALRLWRRGIRFQRHSEVTR